jgi:outer membrane protein OmpA-like peptidoglycan-associated protein
MMRVLVAVLALAALSAMPASAGIACDDLGVGVTLGVMQPSGGDQDYEDSGLIMGIQIRKPLTDRVAALLDYHHGVTQNGESAAPIEGDLLGGRFSGWGEADEFRTVWNHADLSAVVNFGSEGKFVPFVSGGLGFTFWQVQDWRDAALEEGAIPDGYNTDGKLKKLRGTNFTAVLGAGVEIFATEKLACTIGGRYNYLLQQEVDNVGLSVVNGPDAVDANNSVLEGYLGLMYYFGPGDCDGDGIIGSKDKCSRKPEDFDGFEDEDGCPDPDNDGDGILDVNDKCPNDAEDFDGVEDEDGCPDVDRDGDGIMDIDDKCPDQPEDVDGYMDADGCPDPDNDGDGVLDAADRCPDTPRGTEVDVHGCPKPVVEAAPVAQLIAVMVNFDLAKDAIRPDAAAKLDALAKTLLENPDLKIEIAGNTCDLGSTEYNQALSERRAKAVDAYLAKLGVEKSRMTTVAYGEMQPLVPNDTEGNREQNRRAMITPVRP